MTHTARCYPEAFSGCKRRLLGLAARPILFPEGSAAWDVGKEKTLQTNSNS
jgi:hypothetical protein